MKIKTKAAFLIVPAIIFCASSAFAADAAANWTQHCASCHGKDGTGNTMMGKKLGVKDYTTAEGQKFSDADAEKAIKEGVKDGGKDKMKSFKDKLSDAEVKALIAYTRSLKK